MEALDFVQRMVNFDRLMEGENRDSGDPDDIEHWCAVYAEDRKSTRLNSSHLVISYAVFCLKKKKKISRLHVSVLMGNVPFSDLSITFLPSAIQSTQRATSVQSSKARDVLPWTSVTHRYVL